MPSSGVLEFSSFRLGSNYKNQEPLDGCMRDFKMLNAYLSDDQLRAVSFSFLYYSDVTLLDMRLDSSEFVNPATSVEAVPLSRKSDKVFVVNDFGPAYNCFREGESKNLLFFEGDRV